MTSIRHMRITVDGKSYDVTAEVLDDDSVHASHPAPATWRAPAVITPPVIYPQAAALDSIDEGNNLRCPISGTVITIHVQQGQQIKKGDAVITLEAMKMNTSVFAPYDCVVSEIKARPGASIEEGAVIAVLS